MRQPKKPVGLTPSVDAQPDKDVSDQNTIDLNGFHDQAQAAPKRPISPSAATTMPSTGNDLNDSMTDGMPKPAPDFRNGETAPEGQSTLPLPSVTHPELMARPPIPTPPAMTLLPPLNGGQVKDSLAWRARAYKLRSETGDVKTGLTKSFRVINASFDDTLNAVTNVCAAQRISVDSEFDQSGQMLVHPGDQPAATSRFIIAIKPVSKSSTLIRIGLDTDNHAKQSVFDDLLNRIETAANEKGVL
ncbi:MAG TPA: hypothetical protein V6C76_04540 [Drouetiella sp.]